MSRVVIASVCLLVFASCCSYSSHARTSAGGQQLCAKHHLPLVTAHGFSYAGNRVVLIHYKPYKDFEKIDACTPNRIDDMQSLQRHEDITKPVLVTYCPRCEAEFQQRWNGPVITMAQLVGTWRHAKTGLLTTIEQGGRCHGVGYDGKLWVGQWRIVHRGVIATRYTNENFTFYHTITHIEPDFFLDRADEGTDKFVRVR